MKWVLMEERKITVTNNPKNMTQVIISVCVTARCFDGKLVGGDISEG